MTSHDSSGHPQDPTTEDPDIETDTEEDPAHDIDEDDGWTSEGGATPSGPATDVGPDD